MQENHDQIEVDLVIPKNISLLGNNKFLIVDSDNGLLFVADGKSVLTKVLDGASEYGDILNFHKKTHLRGVFKGLEP